MNTAKKNQRTYRTHKIFGGALFVFTIIFIILATSVNEIWFREDDIGTIRNGIVSSWQDVQHLFSTDVRNFICPINYQRSRPNFLSGFLRPFQHLIFTLILPWFNFNPYAYFLFHVGVHALNCALLFLLCTSFIPLSYSICTAFIFGFYPDVSWLTWIATLQNSLATLFLLLMGITYTAYIRSIQQNNPAFFYYWLSGLLLLCSLLSRENGITVPLWIFVGLFLLLSNKNNMFISRIQFCLYHSLPLFIALTTYWLMRLWAFGIGTLSRTFNNLLLRLPLLKSLFPQTLISHSTVIINQQQNVTINGVTQPESFIYKIKIMLQLLEQKFFNWTSSLLMISPSKIYTKLGILLLFLFLIIFLYKSYRSKRPTLFFLLSGIFFMCWPGVVAYPCPRYLNTVYPVIAFMLMYGLYLLFKEQKRNRLYGSCACLLFIFLTTRGAFINRYTMYRDSLERIEYKERFDSFFAHNKLPDDTSLIVVLSSPFVSDIQSIFQIYSNNLSLQVAHEPFATLAEQGVFSCNDPYRCTGTQSEIIPISGGFRLQSKDPQHCAWWMEFSDHPLEWSARDRAYVWRSERYSTNTWYPCSIGHFKIHERINKKFITDISFTVDQSWLSPTTIFVVWDTEKGMYRILDSKHLMR